MPNRKQKLRLLYLAEIFKEETDENHSLTGPQIIDKLQAKGVEVERKTLYDDIDCLKEFGMDIQNFGHKQGWGIVSRKFQDTELQLLADAVQSSRFLTKKKSKDLVAKIGLLGSRYVRDNLTRRVFVALRIKNQNETVFYNLDAAERAIEEKRKLTFVYYQRDAKMNLVPRKNEEKYVVSPIHLLYKDEFYYLVALDNAEQKVKNYRLDRMKRIRVIDEDAHQTGETKNFDIEKYQRGTFSMYPGKAVKVTMQVKGNAMNAVVDVFSKDNITITKVSDKTATIVTEVKESPTFYGWLSQFKDGITLLAPESTRGNYVAYLREMLQKYE